MVQVAFGDEIMQLESVALAEAVVHDDELDLHFLWQDVLDVNTHSLAGVKILLGFDPKKSYQDKVAAVKLAKR